MVALQFRYVLLYFLLSCNGVGRGGLGSIKARMDSSCYALWTKCSSFTAGACDGRDATHGLQHMEEVCRGALLIAALEGLDKALWPRVILVALLHDVADHKYDRDGAMSALVAKHIRECIGEFAGLFDGAREQDVLVAIAAISYSTEARRGMRWFEKELADPRWVAVRDVVSDADKLCAIGGDGLERCLEYALSPTAGHHFTSSADVVKEVRAHAEEKLLRLKDAFIVTRAGKHLAAPKHDEMVRLLEQWERVGLPSRYNEKADTSCGN